MMTDEPDLFSRELIELTGLRSNQISGLFALLPNPETLSRRDRAKLRVRFRRDLSRIKLIYEDRLQQAELLDPTKFKKQTSRLNSLGKKLLDEMKKVEDWSFLHERPWSTC